VEAGVVAALAALQWSELSPHAHGVCTVWDKFANSAAQDVDLYGSAQSVEALRAEFEGAQQRF